MKVFAHFLLLVSATCFLIYEKIPLNNYAIKVRNELKEIGAIHSLEEAELEDYEYEKDSYVYSLALIESKAVFFNVNMLAASASTETGTLSLDWEAKSGETSYISPYHSIYRACISRDAKSLRSSVYDIEFEVEVSKFKFEKSWELNTVDNFYYPTGVIDNSYVSFKVKKLDEECPFSEEVLLEVINAFLNERKSVMNDVFTNNGVKAYYLSLPMGELSQKVYTQTSTTIANENNIDLTLEEKPEFTSDSFILKRKGKLNDLDISGDPTFTDTSSSQKFNINKKLIQNLISQNLFDIIYEQSTNPSYEYVLTVEYLKKIMDITEYSDSTELKVDAKMTDVTFNDENAISGTVSFTVNVIEREKLNSLLTFSLKIEFVFTPTLLQNGLNFVLLSKNLNIVEVKPTETVKDQDLLVSWIKDTYLCALGYSEYNLFSLAFDLSYYFSTNELKYEFNDNFLSIIKQ
jgi:hypothetical protein